MFLTSLWFWCNFKQSEHQLDDLKVQMQIHNTQVHDKKILTST